MRGRVIDGILAFGIIGVTLMLLVMVYGRFPRFDYTF